MSSLIENCHTQFHTLPTMPISNIIEENEKFGIITLKINKTNIITIPTLFLFTIDTTGSMSEYAYKTVSKLAVVKQTFRSMITYLSNLETQIYIRVHSFNETVDVIVDTILITKDNISEIISKIDNLFADKSTNIGEALKRADEFMKHYSNEFPTHQLVHIFMTDGEPTNGITNENELSKLVNTRFTNNFVGFGLDHNASLLKKLSDLENSEYLFVDNMENTTMIYGETIHRYLYSAIKNAEIIIENGIIYNWKTNTWDTKLVEPVIVSESEKIYHIKSKNIDELYIELNGVTDNDMNNIRLIEVIEVMPELMLVKPNDNVVNDINEENEETAHEIIPNDLSKYIFRQRTQELLFMCKNILDKDNNIDIDIDKKNFKTALKSFFEVMRVYMKDNNLLKDKFMITLCDDICITYRSFGSATGLMYSAARATSQGRQQAYNATPIARSNNIPLRDFPDIPDFELTSSPKPPRLMRGVTRNMNMLTQEFIDDVDNNVDNNVDIDKPKLQGVFTENDDTNSAFDKSNDVEPEATPPINVLCDIDEYELSNDVTSCYATEGSLNTMMTMSQL